MKKIFPVVGMILIVAACKKDSMLAPVAGNGTESANINGINASVIYPAIKIGSQKWMAKNLDVTKYRNGDKIPQVKNTGAWAGLTTGAWCWYNNDSATGAVYGKLYNWFAVHDPRGLVPTGWHIPSNAEWDTLRTETSGGKLKDTGTIEAGTGLWHAPNKNATNKTGFTGLPGGLRSWNGAFINIGSHGYWWSSTELYTNYAWISLLNYSDGYLNKSSGEKQCGFSIRCVKD